MKYLLTLFGDESGWDDVTPERRPSMKAWDDYTREERDAGAFLGGEGLQPSATATTVRIRAGERRSSPTARSPRPRSSSAASTCSSAPTWTRRSSGPRRSRRRAARSRCGRSWTTRPAGPRPTQRRGGRAEACRRGSSTACSGASRDGRSPPSSACSATSSSPRRRCRTRSWSRSSAGRATACRATRRPGSSSTARNRAIDVLRRERRYEQKLARAGGAGARGGRGGRGGRELDTGRPAAAVLHLLPPGAGPGGAGGADPADARRPVHAGDGARVPRGRAGDGAAARPRQAQDPRGRHPLRGARRLGAARTACARCWRRST